MPCSYTSAIDILDKRFACQSVERQLTFTFPLSYRMSAKRTAIALQLVKQLTSVASGSTPASVGPEPALFATSLCRAAQSIANRNVSLFGWPKGWAPVDLYQHIADIQLQTLTTCSPAGLTVHTREGLTSPILSHSLHRSLLGLLCKRQLCKHLQLRYLRLCCQLTQSNSFSSNQLKRRTALMQQLDFPMLCST